MLDMIAKTTKNHYRKKEINVWHQRQLVYAHLDAGYLPFKIGFVVVLAFCVGLLWQIMTYPRFDVVVFNRIGWGGIFGAQGGSYRRHGAVRYSGLDAAVDQDQDSNGIPSVFLGG